MQIIADGLDQLAKNSSLLSELVRVGRIDQRLANRSIEAGKLLASNGIVLELRADTRRELAKSFRIELQGHVFSD